VVPLLSCEQIRDLMLALDHDTQIEAAISMIDRKDELIKVIQEDFVTLETQHSSILPKLSTLKDEIPELEKNISGLSSCDDPEAEYELIVRKLRNTKTSIEGLQQSVREIQSFLKLPFKILNEKEHSELRDKYTKLLNVTTENAKELHKLFSLLTSDQDGLTLLLQKQWQQIKSSLGGAASRTHDKREEKSNPEAASTGNLILC
jgi:chromosome segregation ATPase